MKTSEGDERKTFLVLVLVTVGLWLALMAVGGCHLSSDRHYKLRGTVEGVEVRCRKSNRAIYDFSCRILVTMEEPPDAGNVLQGPRGRADRQ